MLTQKEQSLLDALEPLAAQNGVEIVTVDVVGARKSPTIRVYIDTPDGVTFDELTEAQVWINDLMDEIDPFPGAYVLEVSSPGIDRPLRTPAHFMRFVGDTAQIRARSAIDGRANWTGTIVSADEEAVTVSCDGQEWTVPYDVIKRANLKGTIEFH